MAFGRPRIRLVDEVAAELRDRVLRGDYTPGHRLLQEQLAAEFDVSRTPVREAMRLLEREGLVHPDRAGGVRVVERDPATLLSAYELREVVDGLAARLAARDRGAGLAGELAEALRSQREVLDSPWDPDLWTKANTRFHGLLMDGTYNPYLRTLLPFVQMTSQVFRPMSVLGRERAAEAYAEHRAIEEAVLCGDPEDAERLARAHISGTAVALRVELRAELRAELADEQRPDEKGSRRDTVT